MSTDPRGEQTLAEAEASRREKRVVALSSVVAAFGLTIAKLVVGFLTGSLGLLAEALHSGMDLVAALATLFAVRLADKPPDPEHPYGHARIENVTAFVEALLLLGTAAWIIWEAIQRLLGQPAEVEPSIWAFAVMIGSIVVDYTRSRALRRVAKKHRSEALAADALHFETDIWSSAVVILGLLGVLIGQQIGQEELFGRADAVAALLVALLVVYMGGKLAWEMIDALIDRAPEETAHRIAEAAASVPTVLETRRVRLRRAGSRLFADIVVTVPRTTTFAQTHDVTEQIETAVGNVAPDIDVIVHVEPAISREESAVDRVHFLARQLGVRAHNVRVRDVGGALEADLHLEVDPTMPLDTAHDLASRLEQQITDENPEVRMVSTHLEAPEQTVEPRREVTADQPALVERVRAIAASVPGVTDCHEVHVYQVGPPGPIPHHEGRGTWTVERRGPDPLDGPRSTLHGPQSAEDGGVFDLVIHCTFPPHLSVAEVHERSAQIEHELRRRVRHLASVLVHAEPE